MKSIVARIEVSVRESIRRSCTGKVLLGLSGGADSVALLNALLACGREMAAVHCNFHLRGNESLRDMEFCRALCQRKGVELTVVDFDVETYRRNHGVSVEEACRDLRYAEFRRIAREAGYDRIAVAHHADDNAETVLLNLFRGTGITGLRGMLPDTGEIIRPLLPFSRKEILEYLESKKEDFVTDSTNLSDDYRRNFIRNRILPLIEEEWPAAGRAINRAAMNLLQEERVLDDLETRLLTDEDSLPYPLLEDSTRADWLIHRFAARHGASPAISGEMQRLISSGASRTGKRWILPDGSRIDAERDRFVHIEPFSPELSHTVPFVAEECSGCSHEEIRRIGNNELRTPLPPDKIEFRHFREGDRIKPAGMTGSTTVSKIFKDAKLSRAEKESRWLAVEKETGDIIWVEGLKRSRLHLVENPENKVYRYYRKF